MAITLKSSPRSPYNPAYNPIVYVFDSNEKSRAGFRYIIEITTADLVPFPIGSLKVAPRPGDGYGYVDISGIIKNYVDKALVWTGDYDAGENVRFNYVVKFGEEYQITAGYNTVRDEAGFLTFVRTSAPHGLTNLDVGSPIVATNTFTNYPDSRQRVNGTHTIKSIPNGFEIQTTTPWSVIGSLVGPVGGTWRFADRRMTRSTGQIKKTGMAINAAIPLSEFKTYIDSATSPWQDNSAQGELLTSMPLQGYRATLSQWAWLHCMNRPIGNAQRVVFTNSNGDTLYRDYLDNTPDIKSFAIGPGNLGTLSLLSGSAPLIKPTTEWYTVRVVNLAGTWQSQEYRIDLDRRCAIEPIQILFMDRKSSWLSYAFQLRQKERITTEKSTFRKEIPKELTPSWVTIQTQDRGTQTFHSRVRKEFELNTDWMGDAMSLYFEELLSSPYTYINMGDGEWYACQVTDGTFETQRFKNERLIRKTITVYMSIESPIQSAGTITPFQGAGYNLSDGFVEPAPGDWNPRNLGVSL